MPRRGLPGGVAGGALVFLLYSAVTVWFTWPLARAPARLGTPNLDAYGNMWALAWVAHQAVRDPLHLFDANMYFPWSRSLAYAESLIPQALQAAPILALGGSVLLAYNVVLLFTFPLSALGAYLLAADFCHSRRAAFLAGFGYGFFAYRWDHIVHIQSLSTQWLPFALFFARRAIRSGGAASLLGMGICTLLQALSSGYFAVLALAAAGIAILWEAWQLGSLPRLGRAVGVLVLCLVPALPVFLQYRAVQQRHGFSRGRAESMAWSARFASYLDPGPVSTLPHVVALNGWAQDREPLFPGSWALLFGAAGALAALRGSGGGLALGWLAVGFSLSLGPEIRVFGLVVPGPFELFRLLPGGRLLRTPSRLGVLAVLGLVVLAAIAWARLVGRGRLAWVWTVLAAGLILADAYPGELHGAFREIPRAPASVAWLASAKRGAVLELPWNQHEEAALYLYWSTRHWQPMVNGYASFEAPGNLGLGMLGNRWPSEYSARVFRAAGIRYVLVHADRLSPSHRDRLLKATRLPDRVSLAIVSGPDRIYEIEPAPAP